MLSVLFLVKVVMYIYIDRRGTPLITTFVNDENVDRHDDDGQKILFMTRDKMIILDCKY